MRNQRDHSFSRICLLFRLCCLALILILISTDALAGPPNFILIIADDMGAEDCLAYGHPKIQTPNLDRLAKSGMRFDRAFLTCSSCSPSRSSMITGRYPHSTDAEELHWPLPASQVTFVEKLKAAGYYTAVSGKWHLGNEIKDRFNQVNEANPAGYQLPTGKNAAKAKMTVEGSRAAQSGCDQWVPVLQNRPKDKPFFLWLAALDPHREYTPNAIDTPHRPEDVVVPPYLPDTIEVRKDLALYYDEISRLDHYVGEVLNELEKQGVRKDTYVMFTSDNGRPFPRCKTTVYDSGVRTPLIISKPGTVAAASVCNRLVSSVDFAPTILKLAGLPAAPSMQGKDFSVLLSDPTAKIRETIFAEHNWHDYSAHARAVRTERFKYIKNNDFELTLSPPADAVRSPTFETMRLLRDAKKLNDAQMACFKAPRAQEELYDLDADPHELINIASDPKHAETLKQLRSALETWAVETKDFIPSPLTRDEFDRETGVPKPDRARPRVNPRLKK